MTFLDKDLKEAAPDEAKWSEDRRLSCGSYELSHSLLLEHSFMPTASIPPPGRDARKLLILVCLAYANFWSASSVSLQAPFFPKEAESKGATPTEYGFVFGVYELAVTIFSPLCGKLISTTSPKFLITTGALVGGSACCLFGILDKASPGTIFLSLCYAVRVVEGLGTAALKTASFTIAAVAFPDSVAASLSVMETAAGFGLIAGPTIGGILYELGGFPLPFAVNGSFLLVGCILLQFLMPNFEDANREESSHNLFKFLASGGLIVYLLSILSSTIFIGFNAATLEPHLRKFGLSPVILGLIFMIIGGTYTISTPLWGKAMFKGVKPIVISIIGYVLTCAGLLFIGPVPFIPLQESVGIVVGSLVVIGFGLAAKQVSSFVGALQDIDHREFPDSLATYGMVSALFSSACSLGSFIGPSLGGILLENTGYPVGTLVVLAIEVILFLFVINYGIRRLLRIEESGPENETDYILVTDRDQEENEQHISYNNCI